MGPSLHGWVVSMHEDNKNTISYLLKEGGGTHSPSLMSIFRCILALADRWQIEIQLCYVLGIANLEAHALSCNQQVSEWCLLLEVTQQLFHGLVRLEVDLFALAENAVVQHFFSIQCADSEALGLDAFQHAWHFLVMFSFRPPHLILQTFAKFMSSPGVLLLMTPWWQDVHDWARQMHSHFGPQCPS